ncbi:hypothetical protein [Bacillus sp. AG4(2022)]|uniref:hypothetical protein n=1 Tax=Bacillus sp. AG4(2022) TaxID=2962594 RepID=UPI002881738F|nr:hypothetical protein [Bacillus sp. AG4(2022)]MDT0160316.1 hypothetical protein [Bacillus sp. AG4(2022)]
MDNQFRIEKVRDDGTKLEIRIRINEKQFILDDIGVKPKGKRKFTFTCGTNMTNDYSYRSLSIEERKKYKFIKMLEVCPVELMNEAMEEAWQSIKPNKLGV